MAKSLREYLAAPPAVSPLRKSLQAQQGLRQTLQKAQARTHDMETWGYYDFDDPGEAEGVTNNENAIVDQEAVTSRKHTPGYHGKGYRKPVAKSESERPRQDNASHYADVANKKYPIDTAEHVRAAISYFSQRQNSARYPRAKQQEMWARIRRAAKRFGIHMNRDDGFPKE